MNQVILITGASSGFGRTAAELLAEHGYTVFATMRDSNGRNRSAREALQSLGSRERWNLSVLDMDVTNDVSVNQAVVQMLRQTGRIDVVINNAGISAVGITEAFTSEEFQRVLDVNLLGAVRVNRAVLPTMRRQGSGLLIHVSSVVGRVAFPGYAAYSASKYALEALADSYRYELSEFGIDSILVEPGIYRTPIIEKSLTPAENSRAIQYGSTGEAVRRLGAAFQESASSPETPGPEMIAQAFLRLIEMPAGERPLRTMPSTDLQPLLDPYNSLAASIRESVAQRFGLSELTVLRQTASPANNGANF